GHSQKWQFLNRGIWILVLRWNTIAPGRSLFGDHRWFSTNLLQLASIFIHLGLKRSHADIVLGVYLTETFQFSLRCNQSTLKFRGRSDHCAPLFLHVECAVLARELAEILLGIFQI